MHVLKFGGTSMGDEHTWRRVLDIISNYENPVVVVSATERTTRQLVAAADLAADNFSEAEEIAESIRTRHRSLVLNFLSDISLEKRENALSACSKWIDQCISTLLELLQQISEQGSTPAIKDTIASIGEQLSAYLLSRCGQAAGLQTTWIDATQVINTDSDFGQAIPDRNKIQQNIDLLSSTVKEQSIPIMGGYYGQNDQGQITTLGFEGSDYTASLIGAALGAEAIEIWTDVSGIYTCDPQVVETARPIAELSFQEATELAYFGAKVLHPSTMKPAAAAGIAVYVKNIFEPSHPGTKIHAETVENGWAKAITYLNDIIILTVTAAKSQEGHRFLAAVFNVLDNAHQPVNAVTTTEAAVSVALPDNRKVDKLEELLSNFGSVELEKKQGLISIIGCSFNNIETIQNHVLAGIPGMEPSLISYSKSKQNLNIALSETSLIPAVCRIHDLLFEKD